MIGWGISGIEFVAIKNTTSGTMHYHSPVLKGPLVHETGVLSYPSVQGLFCPFGAANMKTPTAG